MTNRIPIIIIIFYTSQLQTPHIPNKGSTS